MKWLSRFSMGVALIFGVVSKSWAGLLVPGLTDSLVTTTPSGLASYGSIYAADNGSLYMAGGSSIVHVLSPTNTLNVFTSGVGNVLSVVVQGSTMYLGNSAGQIHTVDVNNPAAGATFFSSVPTSINDLIIAPAGFGSYGGTLLAVTRNGEVVSIDPGTGVKTFIIGPSTSFDAYSNLSVTPDGRVLITHHTGNRVLEVSPTGVITEVAAQTSTGPRFDGIVTHQGTGISYITNSSFSGSILSLDAMGNLQTIADDLKFNSGWFPGQIELSVDGTQLYYGVRDQLRVISGLPAIVSANPVPSPATVSLFLLGAIVLTLRKGRRR